MGEEIWDPVLGKGRKLEFPGGKGGVFDVPISEWRRRLGSSVRLREQIVPV